MSPRRRGWPRFLRATGEPSLEALQARAVADPGWFWGAAADDIGIAWDRRPTQVLDLAGGPAWARWWRGGAFDYARAATEPRAATDPDGEALVWEGEDGEVRRLTNAELVAAVDCRGEAAPRRTASGPATASGSCCRCSSRPWSRCSRSAGCRRSTRRSSAATARRRSRPGSPIARRRCSSPRTASSAAGRGCRSRPSRTRRSRRHRRSAACWSCGARATPSTRRGRPAAMRGGTSAVDGDVETRRSAARSDPETPYMLIYTSGTTGRPKGAVHVHGGFPIKGAQDLAHQFDLGRGDTPVLVHRPRLDDGSVGDLRVAAARRAAGALRGRARLPRSGPAVVARRAPPGHPPGPVADRHPRADGPRRGAGPRARPLVAARPRLDRRAVEPRPVVVVLPRGRRGPLPDRQLLGRHRGLRRDRLGQPARADQAGLVLRAVHRDGRGRRGRDAVRRSAARSASSSSGADARHDPRLLARPRALRGDVLVAHPGHLGPRRLGERRRGRLLVHPWPLRRHAQGRRQARRAGGGGERRRVAPGRPGGGRDRRAARDQGRGRRRPLRPPPGRDGRRRPARLGRAGLSRTSSASRSSPKSWPSSRRCRRRAPARSCAAWRGRRGSGSTQATSRRSTTR